jgi:hypothetical protein
MPKKSSKIFDIVIVMGGLGLTSYGTWMAWHPGGFIVSGVTLLAIGLFA